MPKKTSSKSISKTKFLSMLKQDVLPESCFRLVSGLGISNLKQLSLEIDKMPEERAITNKVITRENSDLALGVAAAYENSTAGYGGSRIFTCGLE